MLPQIFNIEIDSIELEKDLTWCIESITPEGNLYEVIFNSPSLYKLESYIVQYISSSFNENYSTYLRTIKGYIQTKENPKILTISKVIKRGLTPISEYSFIYFIDANKTTLKFKTGDITIKDKELVIFKTDDFVKDLSNSINRKGFVGGLTNRLSKKPTEFMI